MTSEAPATDAPPSTDAPAKGATEKAQGNGNPGKKRGKRVPKKAGGGRRRGPRHVDTAPPRFDVVELAELSGPPLGQAVHPAEVSEVTDAAVFVQVKPRGHDPLRAMIDPKEFLGGGAGQMQGDDAAVVGAELTVRLLDPPKPPKPVAEGETPEPPVPIASLRQANALALLEGVLRAKEANEALAGTIVAEVKGGYTVAIGEKAEGADEPKYALRAFLPKSHGEHPRLHEHTSPVGESDTFSLTELETERANIVVSRRKQLRKRYDEAVKGVWEHIKVGQKVTGRVRALVAYGAFVDLGGLDALLHASDLSWDRQPRVSSVLKVGQEVTAEVLSADKESGKIKIGLKQLIPNPWKDITSDVKVGDDIEGDVVALTDYGAFVRVRDGVEGLIHLSEVSWDRVKHVSDRFTIGERITARVLEADFGKQRLSLSTKALEPNPFAKVAEAFPKGTVVRAKVKSLTDFGAFVALNENVDGLIHIGEMSWTEHVTHPSQLVTLGEEVEVVVLDVDVGRQRVACSIKQLTENPWKKWEEEYQSGKRVKLKPVRVTDRGAFFELDDGLTGYCSSRDLSSDGARASDVVKVGEEIELEVKGLDRRRRQVGLSARAVVEGDTRAAYDEYKRKEAEAGKGNATFGDALKGKLGDLGVSASDDAEQAPPAKAEAADDAPAEAPSAAEAPAAAKAEQGSLPLGDAPKTDD